MEIYISWLVLPITNFQVAIDTGNGPDYLVSATLILNVVKNTASRQKITLPNPLLYMN
jgi:hypothetical protein